MSEQPRRVPHPQSLAVRQQQLGQRGNAISVRQKPDQDAGWGTLQRPKRFELPLLTPHRIKSRLGYEAVPASEFWQFSISGPVRLQVNRLSKDRYANSVGVALLDQHNRRVAPLVQSASGRGAPVDIPAGTYKVVAALGIAENLRDLVFEFLALPIGARLQALGVFQLGGQAAASSRALQGLGVTTPLSAGGRPLAYRQSQAIGLAGRQLQAIGLAATSAAGVLSRASSSLQGVMAAAVTGRGMVRSAQPLALQAVGQARSGGRGRLASVRWLDEPQHNWRARRDGGVLELNRAYVRPAAGATESLLAGIAAALS